MQSAQQQPGNSLGFNVIGHITGNLGLAVAARNTIRALESRGVPCALFDVDPGYGRGGRHDEFAHALQGGRAPYGVNLFHLNPPQIMRLVSEKPSWLDLAGSMNVVVPFWELPHLPLTGGWHEVLSAVDLTLAPTRFVLDSVLDSLPDAHVVHYPQAVSLPAGVKADRDAFGLSADGVHFLVSLDVTSDPSRKNPGAAVEAFIRANAPGARLVVKLSNSSAGKVGSRGAKAVLEMIAHAPNVTVIDKDLDYAASLSLTASCDAYISLHRSEGLGLNLLEAMSLGLPVVCTAWSGNMDFTGADDSCQVGYRLVPVGASHPDYRPEIIGEGQVWADPDVDEAARWISQLSCDADLRAAIGERARSSMAAREAEFLRARFVDDVSTRVRTCTDIELAARTEQWARIAHVPTKVRLRRSVGGMLRSLGLRD